MVKMYSIEVGAGCCEISVAQMLKLYLSFMKVSVAVVAGADDFILLPFKKSTIASSPESVR